MTSHCFDHFCNFCKCSLRLQFMVVMSFDDAVKLVSSADNLVTQVSPSAIALTYTKKRNGPSIEP